MIVTVQYGERINYENNVIVHIYLLFLSSRRTLPLAPPRDTAVSALAATWSMSSSVNTGALPPKCLQDHISGQAHQQEFPSTFSFS